MIDRKKATCHHCGKVGHFKTECWKLVGKPKKFGKGKKSEKGKKGNNGRDEANIAGPSVSDFSLQVEPTISVSDQSLNIVTKLGYIADSGTTNHIVGERERFIKYKQFKHTVKTADGTPAQVLGIGEIRLRSRVGEVERYFTISEVYHIPGFANLISIGQLGNKGVETRFPKRELTSKKHCQFIRNGQIFMEGREVSKNLYMLDVTDSGRAGTREEDAALTASGVDKIELVHRRLGHASISAMEKLISQRLLPAFTKEDIDGFKERICVPCVEGKQHRTPFPTSTTKTTSPLKLIHTDLQGPMSVASAQGKRFMMTIWDDFSNYHWSFVLERKSEALATFIHRMEEEGRKTDRSRRQTDQVRQRRGINIKGLRVLSPGRGDHPGDDHPTHTSTERQGRTRNADHRGETHLRATRREGARPIVLGGSHELSPHSRSIASHPPRSTIKPHSRPTTSGNPTSPTFEHSEASRIHSIRKGRSTSQKPSSASSSDTANPK
jgi:hypothetical protein